MSERVRNEENVYVFCFFVRKLAAGQRIPKLGDVLVWFYATKTPQNWVFLKYLMLGRCAWLLQEGDV